MESFKQFLQTPLNERILNLFNKDTEKREEYAEEVFNLLQLSYKSQGGIKGSGFKSPEDMIKKIPFWKIVRKDGKIVAGVMYKDKGGRKSVASFTDGTSIGKDALIDIKKDDFNRAFVEMSGRALGFSKKILGLDHILKYAKTPEEASKILGTELQPVPDDDENIKFSPELKDYFYQREIGGKLHTKIMIGTSGKKIVNSIE